MLKIIFNNFFFFYFPTIKHNLFGKSIAISLMVDYLFSNSNIILSKNE